MSVSQRDYNRTDRIGDLIQRELARLIQLELRDPRVGMITVSDVEVSRDLAYAKVFVSIYNETEIEETIATLNNAAGFLRSLLAKRVKLRIMPKLNFYNDDTLFKAARINKLLKEACVKAEADEIS